MAQPKKQAPKRGKYEEPLKVNGSFIDLVKSAVKQAKGKEPKPRG